MIKPMKLWHFSPIETKIMLMYVEFSRGFRNSYLSDNVFIRELLTSVPSTCNKHTVFYIRYMLGISNEIWNCLKSAFVIVIQYNNLAIIGMLNIYLYCHQLWYLLKSESLNPIILLTRHSNSFIPVQM